jgi:hypothetical protein
MSEKERAEIRKYINEFIERLSVFLPFSLAKTRKPLR